MDFSTVYPRENPLCLTIPVLWRAFVKTLANSATSADIVTINSKSTRPSPANAVYGRLCGNRVV